MAKRPSRTRKTAASRRTSAAKRSARSRAPRRATAASAKGLDLKRLRRQLDLSVASLSRLVEVPGGPSAKVSAAQTFLTRWAGEIDELCDDPDGPCGSSMVIA